MIAYKQIGIIHSPFKKIEGMPIQPKAAKNVKGRVEVFKEYEPGLEGIEDFSYIMLLYSFHLIGKAELKVKPYMGSSLKGVFATRAPARPNPIGISVVKLTKREGNILFIENVDIVDSTPLLDIKPYVPEFDSYMDEVKIGWLENNIHKLGNAKDDGRFL